MDRDQLTKYAQAGAVLRLEAIRQEADAIKMFLRRHGLTTPADNPPATLPANGAARAGRRRPMSRAERRVVSQRMKRYWADRRAARQAESRARR